MIKNLVVACVVSLALASSANAGPLAYSYIGDTFHFGQGVYTQDVDRITGDFVLSDSFVVTTPSVFLDVSPSVLSYSFTDGHLTLTQDNSTARFRVGFNPDGTPVVPGSNTGFFGMWTFDISAPEGGLTAHFLNNGEFESTAWVGAPAPSAINCGGGHCAFADTSISTAYINTEFQADLIGGKPGTWTVEKTPEPASLTLIGVGLAVAAVRRRRKTR